LRGYTWHDDRFDQTDHHGDEDLVKKDAEEPQLRL
jgi:hypothetical protein